MEFWNAVLTVLIYPLAAVAIILDGLSTIGLLKYVDDASELNSRVAWFHTRFGLVRGQAIFTGIVLVPWLIVVHVVKVYSGLSVASLAVGMYLGFSLKQSSNAYFAWKNQQTD